MTVDAANANAAVADADSGMIHESMVGWVAAAMLALFFYPIFFTYCSKKRPLSDLAILLLIGVITTFLLIVFT